MRREMGVRERQTDRQTDIQRERVICGTASLRMSGFV